MHLPRPCLHRGVEAPEERRHLLEALRRVQGPAGGVLRGLALALAGEGPPPVPLPPALVGDPWLLGQAREVLHAAADRTRLGAWFTPTAVARELVGLVDVATPATVLDPACGGGVFLLAAGERWPAARLLGRDVDPLAVEVTRAALELAGAAGHEVVQGDGLVGGGGRVDVVVGNPPFLSQLGAGTARDAPRRGDLRARFGAAVTAYVDEAALFILATVRDLLVEGGVAVLVVPESLLATVDAGGVREAVAATCDVEVVWRDRSGVFPGVPTCALRLVRRAPVPDQVCRAAAPAAEPVDTPRAGAPPTWSHLLATAVPAVDLPEDLTPIADLATATADFRDAYYLLADHVREADREGDGQDPRLVTVGLIDPAHLRWGHAPVRFAKRWWDRPVVPGLPADFLDRRLGRKVLLATQSRVLEVLVDDTGDLLPSTPVITLRTDRPWHLAAALTSPALTALALHRHAGAARSRDAIKLSARQVLALPLPRPGADWDTAARSIRAAHRATDPAVRRRHLLACAAAMDRAYGTALLHWWSERLPAR